MPKDFRQKKVRVHFLTIDQLKFTEQEKELTQYELGEMLQSAPPYLEVLEVTQATGEAPKKEKLENCLGNPTEVLKAYKAIE